ncbi:DUF3298 and DUF4163 domain-containing protein [Ornithinibacillus halophilus]|uniref:DUF3298 domain-containing protein n=1 Tax=Ornithinibacillus halophilus TaxID=930117 RepID=A0A1M5LK21_9BACI|nr:DUF3298 and DUF4163 domain-containing protein [Ornithinibacillus halophilus]SHG65365.1 protein of unknown function [Ornithinibacillus halophilus]
MPTFPVSIATMSVSTGKDKTIYYPQVYNMSNRQFERVINKKIIDESQALIDIQVSDSPQTVVEMLGTFEIKNNQQNVLSLSLTNYTYHHQAAHGMTYIKSLNFDLEKEKLINLEDLFKPNSNYIERISAIIQQQIEQRDLPLINDFTEISPNQDFYLADKTLVIYFQLYDLVPYAYGFPMFPISVYDIQDIINENGPLGRLM